MRLVRINILDIVLLLLIKISEKSYHTMCEENLAPATITPYISESIFNVSSTPLPVSITSATTEGSNAVIHGNMSRGHSVSSSLASSSSSSSSSSTEDQLTPLLFGSTGANTSNGDSSNSCVTCPQTVCTLSKVSYERKAIHHNWRVNGLPDYITYLEKFHIPFELTSNVRFNMTPPNDGQWTFQFFGNSQFQYGTQNVKRSHPLDLRVTYKYITESRFPPKVAFDLWLAAHVEDEYVTLPSQIASFPSMSTQLVPAAGSEAESGQSEKFAWTYLFVWSDIQSKLVSLMESTGLESQVVEFRFVINSYRDENATSVDANCMNWNSEDPVNSGGGRSHQMRRYPHHRNQQPNNMELNPLNNATWPPFLTQMHALMKDDKYADLTVKSGDEEFQIHRVIAAYSSPVLATMIYNLTYEKSESLLDLGDDIGSDVVEELIRYMYTGKVEDIEEISDRLIVAATTYGFPVLKKQCESALIKQVKTENAFHMYALGVEVGSMRLKRRAFNIMKENKSKIVAQSEEFRKLSVHHPDVMYELFLS